MGFREITLQLPTDYTDAALKSAIGRQLGIREFSWQIESKSLDARKKTNIHWLLRIGVLSDELQGGEPFVYPSLEIPWKAEENQGTCSRQWPCRFLCGTGVAAGGISKPSLIERGSRVDRRVAGIKEFESSGTFDPLNNYAFGEGGAGTFSDGKLTSEPRK